MNLFDQGFLYDESIEKDLNKIGKPNPDIPEDKRLQFFAKYLNKFSFFRRISEKKLTTKYIEHITLVERKKD